jgi:hypothetical protein
VCRRVSCSSGLDTFEKKQRRGLPVTLPETIVRRRCAALIPYARNARTHSDQQVAQIAASIREFGFTNPVRPRQEAPGQRRQRLARRGFHRRSQLDRRADRGRRRRSRGRAAISALPVATRRSCWPAQSDLPARFMARAGRAIPTKHRQIPPCQMATATQISRRSRSRRRHRPHCGHLQSHWPIATLGSTRLAFGQRVGCSVCTPTGCFHV